MPQLSRDLIDRLVCAKYIFRRSCELLDSRSPFSAGLAVSGFQDSIELVLRTIAEYLHLSVKESAAFNQIIDAIDVASATKLPYRTALNQLNKARTNFKHFGLEPKEQDARKFRIDLEIFLPTVFPQFFALAFEDISLVDLVGHRRTENFLHKAEQAIEEENYQAAMDACAVAFSLFRLHTKRREQRRFNLNPFNRNISAELRASLDDIKKVFEEQQVKVDILMDGINPVDFQRFDRITPTVTFNMALTIHLSYPWGHRVTPDKESAQFCLRFAFDAIFSMKNIDVPPKLQREPPKPNIKILKRSPAVVWPDTNEIEVIRDVEEGELFLGVVERDTNRVKIILDGDPAYIKLEAAEEIINTGSTS